MYHIYALNSRYFQSLPFPDFFSAGTFGVDIFFILSGYVMALISHNVSPGSTSARSFVFRRGLRVYPIYWIYTLLVLLAYFVYPEGVNSSYATNPSVIRSFLLLPDFSTPLLNVGWTLIYEVYFYCLMALLLFFRIETRNTFFMILFIFLIVYNYFFYISTDPINPFEKYYLGPLICEFILGYWLFFQRVKFSSLMNLIVMVSSVLFVLSTSYWVDINSNFKRLFLFGLPAALFVYSFLSFFEGKRNFRSIVLLGDISFSTYLSHIFVLNVIGVGFGFFEIEGIFGSILCLLVSIFAVYVWSFISYFFIEKKVMSFVRK